MRDMRLSFWSSVYGCVSLLCLLLSRFISYGLQTQPEQLPVFSDPFNFLLTLSAILLLLRATGTASASVKKLRTGKNILATIQIILIAELFYLIATQALHFTLDIDIMNSLAVRLFATVFSLPSVCGLYALYFSKQLRSKIQYFAYGLFCAAIVWNILRITEEVILPLLEQHTAITGQVLHMLYTVAGLNNAISLGMFIAAFLGLIVYAYYSGSAAKKMPEKNY